MSTAVKVFRGAALEGFLGLEDIARFYQQGMANPVKH